MKTLTPTQQQVMSRLRAFLSGDDHIMVMTGPAGSGKTTLLRHLLDELRQHEQHARLMATTGRAARIMSMRTGYPASTIHRAIYKLDNVQVDPSRGVARIRHVLGTNGPGDVSLIIVDEASQLGHGKPTGAESIGHIFGSGNLLADLLRWCGMRGKATDTPIKILFVGDAAQLAPIGQESPLALDAEALRQTFSLRVEHVELQGNCRQDDDSLVVHHARQLRAPSPRLPLDVDWLPSSPGWLHLENDLDAARYRKCFYRGDESMILTLNNARALDLNHKVRTLLHHEFRANLHCGDLLMVARNDQATGLMNGDLVRVERTGQCHEVRQWVRKGTHQCRITLRFREVRIAYNRLEDMRRHEQDCLILENGLDSPCASIGDLEKQALLVNFLSRCKKMELSRDEINQRLLTDPFMNALIVKYGYAMTCHKAQGGEWDTVIVDVPAFRDSSAEVVQRWLYTAFTRARNEVRLLNADRLQRLSVEKSGQSLRLAGMP